MGELKPLRWRVGRSNPYTVYLDSGGPYDEADARDNFLGSFRTPEDAEAAVNCVNYVAEMGA